MRRFYVGLLILCFVQFLNIACFAADGDPVLEGKTATSVTATTVNATTVNATDVDATTITTARSATPGLAFGDSDATDDDDNFIFYINLSATETTVEVADAFWRAQGAGGTAGTMATFMDWDGSAQELTVTGGLVVTGGQVAFPSTQAPSAGANTLDDYEEGIYTPTITCTTSGSYVLDTDFDTLAYTKIGRQVHVQGFLTVASESSPVGALKMSLPFTAATIAEGGDTAVGAVQFINQASAILNPVIIAGACAVDALFYKVDDDGQNGAYVDKDDVDTAWSIRLSLTYFTAD